MQAYTPGRQRIQNVSTHNLPPARLTQRVVTHLSRAQPDNVTQPSPSHGAQREKAPRQAKRYNGEDIYGEMPEGAPTHTAKAGGEGTQEDVRRKRSVTRGGPHLIYNVCLTNPPEGVQNANAPR